MYTLHVYLSSFQISKYATVQFEYRYMTVNTQ